MKSKREIIRFCECCGKEKRSKSKIKGGLCCINVLNDKEAKEVGISLFG